MQSVMDSLCRCFGSTPLNHDSQHELDSMQHFQLSACDKLKALNAAVQGRTTDPSALDGQWDSKRPQRSHHGPSRDMNTVARSSAAMNSEQKQQRRSRTHKRKRSGSRDDIFRTKKLPDKFQPATPPNPLSRFLSSHPVIAHSLCFANPVKDSADTDYNKPQSQDKGDCESSVVSDTNSHNNSTAEDTMTSTVYYETTKLAGLCQRAPPVPLFTSSCLHERDEIQTILEVLRQEQEIGGGGLFAGQGATKDPAGRRREKLAATISTRLRKEAVAVVVPREPEPVSPAVYCSSSNSSGGSKAALNRRTAKQARQM